MAGSLLQDDGAVPVAKLRSPKRIDWATSQSESQDFGDDVMFSKHDVFTTPPRRAIDDAAVNSVLAPANLCKLPSAADKVYDIATLLSYRRSLAGIGVFAKIKPEALAENLFQYIGIDRPMRATLRSRALSELSNPPHGGINSQIFSKPRFPSKYDGIPHRQPQAPPVNSVLQQHDGFARFLKQHASPPHHRVTAGGRIVPAGPLSPPPMFDYASLTGLVSKKPEQRADGPLSQETYAPDLGHPNLRPFEQAQTAFAGAVRFTNGFQPMPTCNEGTSRAFPFVGSHQTHPDQSLQQSESLIPMGMFEDGSMMALHNGLYYRTYWNGTGAVMEPLTNDYTKISKGTQTDTMPHARASQIETKPQPSLLRGRDQRVPLSNTTNRSRVSSAQTQDSSRADDLAIRHSELSDNLRNLDKHLALNHYELSQEERASFVAQRKTLVNELDKFRRLKQSSSQNAPLLKVNGFKHPANAKNEKPGSRQPMAPAQVPMHEQKSSKIGKALSPEAAPFVPTGINGSTSLTPTVLPVDYTSRSSSLIPTPTVIFNARNSASLQGHLGCDYQKKGEPHVSAEQDSIDPAMRIIHNSDVEYATKDLPEQPKSEKKYCTTVQDFQEAIRQVRQQARLYGCAGGSSKDPAYDAEQDIWWAICDRDPIPLPPHIPDHVANPRPWDWNDTVFNHRRSRVIPPISELPASHSRNASYTLGSLQGTASKAENHITVSDRASAQQAPLPSLPFLADNNKEHSVSRPAITPAASPAISTDPPNSMDEEFMAVQNAIDALNRRSQAIMAQAKSLSGKGTFDSYKKPAMGSGTSHFQLAMQNYTRDAQLRSPATFSALNHKQSDSHLLVQKGIPKSPVDMTEKSPAMVKVQKQPDRALAASKQALQRLSLFSQQISLHSGSGKNTIVQGIPRRDPSTAKPEIQAPPPTPSDSLSKISGMGKISAGPSVDDIADYLGSKAEVMSSSNKKARKGGQRDLLARTKNHLSPKKAAKKAKEMYERSKSRSPMKRETDDTHSSSPSVPRVNLPTQTNTQMRNSSGVNSGTDDTHKTQATSTAFDSNEVKSVTVIGPSNDTFLQDLLKSPRYSAAQLRKISGNRLPRNPILNIVQEAALKDFEDNKENAAVDIEVKPAMKSRPVLISEPISERSRRPAAKASSSLAASAYHATGFLPQYDGAGKAHTSTMRQQHGVPPTHRQARVNLPQESSYVERPAPLGEENHHVSVDSTYSHSKQTSASSRTFGFDGSADEIPWGERSSSAWKDNTGNGKQKEFNTMGVTKDDFNHQRADHRNPWHRNEVANFFHDLGEEEAAYIRTRTRQNTKTT